MRTTCKKAPCAREHGFTLMELMIVVALILVIAAIAIPSMKEAKINTDEAAAVASIRAINTAEITYSTTYGGYADSLANLGGAEPCAKSAATACLLDESLTAGTKAGYAFAAVGGNPADGANTTYVVGAAPEGFDRTGRRLFCSTEKNVIRADLNTTGSTIPPNAQQCAGFGALK
ncbi:MAG TPA: type II secretion system protein [Verrucomicrobiae bacterium]|nr:type II secretion system protein [Verrucomicrobiae bacterium]